MVLATTNNETPLIMTFLWEFHINQLRYTKVLMGTSLVPTGFIVRAFQPPGEL